MKKYFTSILLVFTLIFTSIPVYGSSLKIKVDNQPISSDVPPQMQNNRTMVPLRVISENLGAKVDWSNDKITLTKEDMHMVLEIGNNTATKNKMPYVLDVKPYVKNKRTMVPLRFIAETFGCEVEYKNSVVEIITDLLSIKDVKIDSLYYEYHMTMGGVIQEIKGNIYLKDIYNIFLENAKTKVNAPAKYDWRPDIDTPGAYYKRSQYIFKDHNNNDIQQFDIYGLVNAFLPEELVHYHQTLIHDVTRNQWYLSDDKAPDIIEEIMNRARENGMLKVISNTVV